MFTIKVYWDYKPVDSDVKYSVFSCNAYVVGTKDKDPTKVTITCLDKDGHTTNAKICLRNEKEVAYVTNEAGVTIDTIRGCQWKIK